VSVGLTVNERTKRQVFLGPKSDAVLAAANVAVIGVSGGGSHIAQQLAHVGFGSVHLIDPAVASERHRHRLVGISTAAVRRGWTKVNVVRRVMQRAFPEGAVSAHSEPWQAHHQLIRTCDIVFGCVDGYVEREELERYTRRFHVPLIDIGMDVRSGNGGHIVCGQVITSMPGSPCMRCMGFLSDAAMKSEAGRYGNSGDRPQVIWPNGVLASTAVGIATTLLLKWHNDQVICPYLLYDGNAGCVAASPRLLYVPARCEHFDVANAFGDPGWALR
jgi:hypothetical protein